MGSSASLPFEPTFTQGLITGQLSILILLVLVLRHLFFDSRVGRRLETPTYHPRLDQDEPTDSHASTKGTSFPEGFESVAWLNIISQSVRNISCVSRTSPDTCIGSRVLQVEATE
jgi:maintenance of morphology protein 1